MNSYDQIAKKESRESLMHRKEKVHQSQQNSRTKPALNRNNEFVQVQRLFGNQFLQRQLAIARQDEGEAEATPDIESAIQRKRGGGQSLDSGVRGQMESAFGADFSAVNVHTDSEADTLNRSLSARAFTTGQDIFFKQGEYNPGSSSGRELLAHELTHVVQQNGDEVQTKLAIGQPGDIYEQEADKVANQVIRMEHQPSAQDTSQGLVNRQTEEEEPEGLQPKLEEAFVQRQFDEDEEQV
jgi:hypothetical protein